MRGQQCWCLIGSGRSCECYERCLCPLQLQLCSRLIRKISLTNIITTEENETTFKILVITHIIVLKSSSTRIMSAASLQTSVPFLPIAIPISAFFRATPSLTPSPVMPTIIPCFWKACRINVKFEVYWMLSLGYFNRKLIRLRTLKVPSQLQVCVWELLGKRH